MSRAEQCRRANNAYSNLRIPYRISQKQVLVSETHPEG